MAVHTLTLWNGFTRFNNGAAWNGVANPATTFNVDTGTIHTLADGDGVGIVGSLVDTGVLTSDVITSVVLAFDWQIVSGNANGGAGFARVPFVGGESIHYGSSTGSFSEEVISWFGLGPVLTRAQLYVPGTPHFWQFQIASRFNGVFAAFDLRVVVSNFRLIVTDAGDSGVNSLTPASGDVAGGQSVTIKGAGFSAAHGVTFGGSAAAWTMVDDTTIHVTTPAHAAGVVDVVVAGVGTLSGAYTYTYGLTAAVTVPALATNRLPPIPMQSPVTAAGKVSTDWAGWLRTLKARVESLLPASGFTADLAISGSPVVPWDHVLKAGSSLNDLATIDAGNRRVLRVGDPATGTDGANKRYVDGRLVGSGPPGPPGEDGDPGPPGPAGPPGVAGVSPGGIVLVAGETPGGSINSSNTVYTTANTYQAGTLEVFLNGVRQKAGGVDYTETSSGSFTMATAPVTGDTLLIDYQAASSGGGSVLVLGTLVPGLQGPLGLPGDDGADSWVPGATGATGAAGASGAKVLLSEIVTAASQATVDFTSISGAYRELEIIWFSRDTHTGTSLNGIIAKINNDATAANYTNVSRIGSQNGAAFATSVAATTAGQVVGAHPQDGNTAGMAGAGYIRLPGYAGTTFHKRVLSDYDTDDATLNGTIAKYGFRWKSTAAITRITLSTDGTAFKDGSTFSLYGLS